MIERLSHPDYWRNIVRASAVAWRQTQSARPIGMLWGWTVWVMDGKAYLFHEERDYCRRCDWFLFCAMVRWLERQ